MGVVMVRELRFSRAYEEAVVLAGLMNRICVSGGCLAHAGGRIGRFGSQERHLWRVLDRNREAKASEGGSGGYGYLMVTGPVVSKGEDEPWWQCLKDDPEGETCLGETGRRRYGVGAMIDRRLPEVET